MSATFRPVFTFWVFFVLLVKQPKTVTLCCSSPSTDKKKLVQHFQNFSFFFCESNGNLGKNGVIFCFVEFCEAPRVSVRS